MTLGCEDEREVRGKAEKNHTRKSLANGSRKAPEEEGSTVEESKEILLICEPK